MKKRICFFEPDEALAGRLIDYWLGHGLDGYCISYYSDAAKWREDCSSMEADLWILDCSLKSIATEALRGTVLWWSDRQEETDAVFKYRSAVVLLHTIQGYLEAERGASGAGVISLYSPVKRCLQTTFGMTLSQVLSTQKRILYLNLEGYSGMERFLSVSNSKDISDFIYYFNQNINQTSNDIPLIIQKFVCRFGEVDVIPPVLNPANLQDITEEMWLRILNILQGSGLYDYIIIDISDFVRGTFAILRESRVIFSLTRQDVWSESKWQQYADVLEKLGYEDILERTRRMEVTQLSAVSLAAPWQLEELGKGALAELAVREAREAGLL